MTAISWMSKPDLKTIGLEGWRDGWMDDAGIVREDYNAWSLCNGKIDWDVSGEVDAQESPMI